ncbi:MAG: hypothetical protein QM744_01680 [Mesorhizobium sp.]
MSIGTNTSMLRRRLHHPPMARRERHSAPRRAWSVIQANGLATTITGSSIHPGPTAFSERRGIKMKVRLLPVALAAISILGISIFPSAAASPKTAFVREHAIQLLEGALTPDQTTKLQLLAHQAAIADVCEGFTIDDAKFSKAFEALAPVDAAKMNDDQKAYHDKHILVIFGVLVGGELTAISDDVSAACEDAAKAKVDPDLASELVFQ